MPEFDEVKVLNESRVGKETEFVRRLVVDNAAAIDYFLVDEVDKGGNELLRYYIRTTTTAGSSPGMVWTHNASWDGAQWVKDDSAQVSTMWRFFDNFGDSVVEFMRHPGGVSPFTDGAWGGFNGEVVLGFSGSGGVPRLILDGANLGAGTPLSNTMYPDLMVKAWGYYETTGGGAGTFAVDEGINVSHSFNGGNVRVTFTNAMVSGTEYAVAATPIGGTVDDTILTTVPLAAGSFDLERLQGGAAFNQDTTKSRVTYIVVGRE